ncbi:hypothetical protein [Pseudomonas profundi]|uniref:hypothetical protein n=1 Tax=Pseudomonas profundi TaxID=1981513 RepID=UPI0012398616|nr:hypothetical protein [Pseudomonas profundi]
MGYQPTPTTLPDGRYRSSGQVQLSDGRLINAVHSIRFEDGRFYALSRQADTLLENAGLVERDGAHHRLAVSHGEVTQLASGMDNELIFSLLYSRREGAHIRLYQIGECLYARASLQVFCP